MNGKVLAFLSVIVGGLSSATAALANDYGRWSGLGEPRWQPPTYAQPYRPDTRIGNRDECWRGPDWDRREPPGNHYGWFRDHHRRHHPRHHRRWWD